MNKTFSVSGEHRGRLDEQIIVFVSQNSLSVITSLSILILCFLFLPDSAECIACVADTVANLKQIRPELGSISELTTAY